MLERKFGRRQFLQFLGLTGAGIALGECKAEVSQTAQPTETPLPTKLPTKTVSRIPTQTLVPKPTASPSPEPTVVMVVTPESKQPETITPGDFEKVSWTADQIDARIKAQEEKSGKMVLYWPVGGNTGIAMERLVLKTRAGAPRLFYAFDLGTGEAVRSPFTGEVWGLMVKLDRIRSMCKQPEIRSSLGKIHKVGNF